MARPAVSRLLMLVAAMALAIGLGASPGLAKGGPGGGHGGGLGGGMGGGAAHGLGGGAHGVGLGGPGHFGLGSGLGHGLDHGDRGSGKGLGDSSPGRSGRAEILDFRDATRLGRKDTRDDLKEAGRKAAEGKSRDVPPVAADSPAAVAVLTQTRQQQVRELLTAHRDVIEPDSLGRPVVRGEILAIAPSPAVVARAKRAGFWVRTTESFGDLGVRSVVLVGPRGVGAVEALRRLRVLDPQGQYDFNHLYQQGGSVSARVGPGKVEEGAAVGSGGVRVGLVDGGVAAGQPVLAGSQLVQKAFAPGGPTPTAHATAVASLIAGGRGRFRGATPGATLLVADVYGSTATGGSAQAIVRGLAWLSQAGVPVINVSLVGPPNLLLEAAVKALIARGHLIVAAVGNDGPAAPPLYPAAYPGVIAVTGVDGRRKLLPEAGRGAHVDFAAPASEMAAAGIDGGFVSVRGTSFAAPITAGLLARLLAVPDPAQAERAVSALGRQAQDLGARGPDPLFGRGLVGASVRTPPAEVRATYALRAP